MSVGQLIIHEDWYRAILFPQSVLDETDLVLRDLDTRPTVPLELGSLCES